MKKNTDLTKLYLLVITLPRGKREIVGDLLEKDDVTAYLYTLARGARDRAFNKRLMFCIVKENKLKDVSLKLEDKFAKFNSKISMFYAIPLDSVIGVSSYMFLANGG